MAVSDFTWTTNSRSKEIDKFWKTAYPEVDTASNKIKLLEGNGYSLLGYFVLQPSSWLENYYDPLKLEYDRFLERNGHSEMAKRIIEENNFEMDLYSKYQDYYSYGFYIAKKN